MGRLFWRLRLGMRKDRWDLTKTIHGEVEDWCADSSRAASAVELADADCLVLVSALVSVTLISSVLSGSSPQRPVVIPIPVLQAAQESEANPQITLFLEDRYMVRAMHSPLVRNPY